MPTPISGRRAPDAASGLPAGGSAGQMLVKNSTSDFDAAWTDPPESGGGSGAPQIAATTITDANLSGSYAGIDSGLPFLPAGYYLVVATVSEDYSDLSASTNLESSYDLYDGLTSSSYPGSERIGTKLADLSAAIAGQKFVTVTHTWLVHCNNTYNQITLRAKKNGSSTGNLKVKGASPNQMLAIPLGGLLT